ncbi:hypothetical protein HF086_005186 [Spodoptera exigua]|uniref:Uncharacterized protein n=1 Tax=Spodoptera exigua TaxID=7107 RepID=A0A922SIG4_SPOEX|nr:hypothetical protein HF086_005186 [Spodoptera exigua]
MYSKYSFVVLLLCVAYTNAAYAPFIKKCKWDDSKCMKATAQNAIPILAAGIPELGVQRLDPFTMKTLDASSPTLKLLLWDVTGTGLKDCIAKKVQRDVEKSKITVKLQCTVDFVGKYEMKGRLLVLPIEGKGDAHVVLSRAAHEMIESSSNEIVKEVGPPLIKAIVGRIIENVEEFFKNVPSSEFTD